MLTNCLSRARYTRLLYTVSMDSYVIHRGSIPTLDIVRIRAAMDKYRFDSTDAYSVFVHEKTPALYRTSDLVTLWFNRPVLNEDWNCIQTQSAKVLMSRPGMLRQSNRTVLNWYIYIYIPHFELYLCLKLNWKWAKCAIHFYLICWYSSKEFPTQNVEVRVIRQQERYTMEGYVSSASNSDIQLTSCI